MEQPSDSVACYSSGLVAGLAALANVAVIVAVGLGFYAFFLRKRLKSAQDAMEQMQGLLLGSRESEPMVMQRGGARDPYLYERATRENTARYDRSLGTNTTRTNVSAPWQQRAGSHNAQHWEGGPNGQGLSYNGQNGHYPNSAVGLQHQQPGPGGFVAEQRGMYQPAAASALYSARASAPSALEVPHQLSSAAGIPAHMAVQYEEEVVKAEQEGQQLSVGAGARGLEPYPPSRRTTSAPPGLPLPFQPLPWTEAGGPTPTAASAPTRLSTATEAAARTGLPPAAPAAARTGAPAAAAAGGGAAPVEQPPWEGRRKPAASVSSPVFSFGGSAPAQHLPRPSNSLGLHDLDPLVSVSSLQGRLNSVGRGLESRPSRRARGLANAKVSFQDIPSVLPLRVPSQEQEGTGWDASDAPSPFMVPPPFDWEQEEGSPDGAAAAAAGGAAQPAAAGGSAGAGDVRQQGMSAVVSIAELVAARSKASEQPARGTAGAEAVAAGGSSAQPMRTGVPSPEHWSSPFAVAAGSSPGSGPAQTRSHSQAMSNAASAETARSGVLSDAVQSRAASRGMSNAASAETARSGVLSDAVKSRAINRAMSNAVSDETARSVAFSDAVAVRSRAASQAMSNAMSSETAPSGEWGDAARSRAHSQVMSSGALARTDFIRAGSEHSRGTAVVGVVLSSVAPAGAGSVLLSSGAQVEAEPTQTGATQSGTSAALPQVDVSTAASPPFAQLQANAGDVGDTAGMLDPQNPDSEASHSAGSLHAAPLMYPDPTNGTRSRKPLQNFSNTAAQPPLHPHPTQQTSSYLASRNAALMASYPRSTQQPESASSPGLTASHPRRPQWLSPSSPKAGPPTSPGSAVPLSIGQLQRGGPSPAASSVHSSVASSAALSQSGTASRVDYNSPGSVGIMASSLSGFSSPQSMPRSLSSLPRSLSPPGSVASLPPRPVAASAARRPTARRGLAHTPPARSDSCSSLSSGVEQTRERSGRQLGKNTTLQHWLKEPGRRSIRRTRPSRLSSVWLNLFHQVRHRSASPGARSKATPGTSPTTLGSTPRLRSPSGLTGAAGGTDAQERAGAATAAGSHSAPGSVCSSATTHGRKARQRGRPSGSGTSSRKREQGRASGSGARPRGRERLSPDGSVVQLPRWYRRRSASPPVLPRRWAKQKSMQETRAHTSHQARPPSETGSQKSACKEPPPELPLRRRMAVSFSGVSNHHHPQNAFDLASSMDVVTMHDPVLPGVSLDMQLHRDVQFDGEDTIGEGASGSVYRGTYLGMQVAVKFAARGTVDGLLQRKALQTLQLESRILSRVRHPNIVRFFGGNLEPPHVFIVEELMHQDLSSLIHNREHPLPLDEALRIGKDIAMGLFHLHPTIIHRDLKPANVLLDQQMRAKISDFGVSRFKLTHQASTRDNNAGTVAYMAPELFQDHSLTPKADVYSWAVIMYEMVTQQLPWYGLNNLSIIYHVVFKNERPELPESPSQCPPELATLIRDCWHPDPKHRPSTGEIIKTLTLIMKIRAWQQQQQQQELAQCGGLAAVAEEQQQLQGVEEAGEQLQDSLAAGLRQQERGQGPVQQGGGR